MKMHFKNGPQIEIHLVDGPATTAIRKIYKHLQHVPLDFRDWDNPFYLDFSSIDELVAGLVTAGELLGIKVSEQDCKSFNQSYYNQLHKIYENAYNGDSKWLDFHEHIHLCEWHFRKSELRSGSIDYRERAGPLVKTFNNAYLTNMVTNLVPGMVYVEWAELGKDPYDYWMGKEPDDLNRLCQLAKPWLYFRPKLRIATQSRSRLSKINPEFHDWWSQRESDWCKHWNLDSWPIERIKGVIQIGIIKQTDLMFELFQQQISIERISL